MKCLDGRVSLARLREKDEAASLRCVRRLVHEDLGADDLAVRLEHGPQLFFGHRFGQVGDVEIGVLDLVVAFASSTWRHFQALVLDLMAV